MLDSFGNMQLRKEDHIAICMSSDVETRESGFDSYVLHSTALPEMALEDVCTKQTFLGTEFALPVMIAGMTGGVEKAAQVNAALARAAQEANVPLGLGSQKLMVRGTSADTFFDVRAHAPHVFLIGNLGAADLNFGISVDDVLRIIDKLKLNAFAFHLNALQECVQPEGNRNFRDVLKALENVVRRSSVPVIVKEVGAGISGDDYRALAAIGVAAVDVGGRGGTSWSRIEGLRGTEEDHRIGELFSRWGVRTSDALVACSRARFVCDTPPEIIATGGIRDGVSVAKAIGLGATLCGIGLPLLRAALSPKVGEDPAESVLREIRFIERSLRMAMFCSGSKKLAHLQKVIRAGSGCCSC